MSQTIKNKIIAFKWGGELVVFDSREEFEATDIREAGISILFASPGDLYRRLLELEEMEEKDDDGGIVTELDSLPQWIEEGREAEKGEVGEEEGLGMVSENAVRAIKAREDERQRKWGCVEDD